MLIRNLRFLYSKSYQILGINASATMDQVKTAYYTKAQLYHPDRNKQSNAKQKFFELNSAYKKIVQKLTQKESPDFNTKQNKNNNYKNATSKKQRQQYRQQYQFQQQYQQIYDQEEFQQFYNQYIKKQKKNKSQRSQKNRIKLDTIVKLILTPQQRAAGCIKQITFKRTYYCNCDSEKSKNVCNVCQGFGSITWILKGVGTVDQICGRCEGRGTIKQQCKKCHGKGTYQKQCTQKVTVPPGTLQNSTIKLEGRAKQSKEHTGEIYVRIFEKKSHNKNSKFKNKPQKVGYDVHTQLTINCIQAILGCTKTVQTLFGNTEVKIERGAYQDQIITLKGYGYQKQEMKNQFGNHNIQIKIHIPNKISEEQEILYRRLEQLQKKGKQTSQR